MKIRILQSITEYSKRKPVRLHMPGHKADRKFCKLFKGANLDITELKNAKNEQAVIDAEQDVASILGAKQSKLLTDGASMAIFAMVYAVKGLGKKLIIERSAHKSVYNALITFGIEPVFVGGIDSDGLNILPTMDDVEKAICENPEVIGALFTYPDYYGRAFDLANVSQILSKYGKKLLIDNAHGGHYAYINGYKYAGTFADVWVDSAHKVLSTLNQGAILSVNDQTLIDTAFEGASVFSTSSPSYQILASIEYGVKSANENRQKYIKFYQKIRILKLRLEKLGFAVMPDTDCFKLVVDFGSNVNLAEEYFEKRNIFAEMNDGARLVFMFSLSNTDRDLRKLERAFSNLELRKEEKQTVLFKRGEKAVDYLVAVKSPFEYVSLSESVNRISACNVGFFPPCYPLVVAGEKITSETATAFAKSQNVFGLNEGKIKVCREELI